MRVRELLDELEWRRGLALEALRFLVVDRGSPGGKRWLSAPEVEGRDRSYLHLVGGGRVPFHRILEVRSGEILLWSKLDRDAGHDRDGGTIQDAGSGDPADRR